MGRVQNPFLLCHIVRLRARLAMQKPEGIVGAINRQLADCRLSDALKPASIGAGALVAPEPLIFNAAVGE